MNFSNTDLVNAEARIRGWRIECAKKRHGVVVDAEAERALACILAQLIGRMSQLRRRGETIDLCWVHSDKARNILDAWTGESALNGCKAELSKEADAILLMLLAILVAGASPRTIWDSPVDIAGAFAN